jgi:hypothetical protein
MKLTPARAAAILAFCAGIAEAAPARPLKATTSRYTPSKNQDLAPIGIAVSSNGIAAPVTGQPGFIDSGIPLDAHHDNLETFPYVQMGNEPESHSSASSTHNPFIALSHSDAGHGPVAHQTPHPESSSPTLNTFSIPGHNAGYGPAQQSPSLTSSSSQTTKTTAPTSTQSYYSNLTGGPFLNVLDDPAELLDPKILFQKQHCNNDFESMLDFFSSVEPTGDQLTKGDFKTKLEEIEALLENSCAAEFHNLTDRKLLKVPMEIDANNEVDLKELVEDIQEYAEMSEHDSPEEIERKQQEAMGILGAWLFDMRERDDEQLDDILNNVTFRRSLDTQLSSGSGLLSARNVDSQLAARGWISDLLQNLFGVGLNTAIGQAGSVAQAGVEEAVEEAAHKSHHHGTKHAITRDNDEVKSVTKPDGTVQHLKHNSTYGNSTDGFLVYFPRYNGTDHRVYAHGMWYEIDEYGAITKYENQPGQAPQEYDLSPDAESINRFSDNLGFNMHQIPRTHNLTQEQTFDFTWESIDEIVRVLSPPKGGVNEDDFAKLIGELTAHEIFTGSASHRDSRIVRRSADTMPNHNLTQEEARAFLTDFVILKKALLHVKDSLEKAHDAKLNSTAVKDVHEDSKNDHHNLTEKQRDFMNELIQKIVDITAVREDRTSAAKSTAHRDRNSTRFPRSVDVEFLKAARTFDPLEVNTVSEPVAKTMITLLYPFEALFHRRFPQRLPYKWEHPPDLGSTPAYKELVGAWKNTEQSYKDYVHKMLLNVWLLRISDLCEISSSWTKHLSNEAQEVELNFKGLSLKRCQAVKEGEFPNDRVRTYWDVVLPKEKKDRIKEVKRLKEEANWANYRQRKADCMNGHGHIGWLFCWMA